MDFTLSPGQPEAPEKTHRVPTIMVAGKASHPHAPTKGQFNVNVVASDKDRETAWSKFQAAVKNLRDGLGSQAEIGNVVPVENAEEVTKAFRQSMEFTVSAEVEISFQPASFGVVVQALIECNIPYSSPSFTFDKTPVVTPELLKAAAEQGRINASAIAEGVGGRLGRLVSVHTGSPTTTSGSRRLRSFLDEPKWLMTMTTVNRALVADWGFDELKLDTYDTHAVITVEYEIIESVDPDAAP